MEKNESVLIIDDLKTDVTKKVMEGIVEKFRVVRHNKQIIILTHHLIGDVPTKLIELSEKVIMFHTKFNPDNPTSKINEIVSKNKKHAIHEQVLSLPNYEYIIIKRGSLSGPYSDKDINPIIGDTNGNEIRLINGNGQKHLINGNGLTNGKFTEKLLTEIPEFDLLTTTEKIIVLKQTYPRLKPKVICQIVGTTASNTWKTLSIARKNGKLD